MVFFASQKTGLVFCKNDGKSLQSRSALSGMRLKTSFNAAQALKALNSIVNQDAHIGVSQIIEGLKNSFWNKKNTEGEMKN